MFKKLTCYLFGHQFDQCGSCEKDFGSGRVSIHVKRCSRCGYVSTTMDFDGKLTNDLSTTVAGLAATATSSEALTIATTTEPVVSEAVTEEPAKKKSTTKAKKKEESTSEPEVVS